MNLLQVPKVLKSVSYKLELADEKFEDGNILDWELDTKITIICRQTTIRSEKRLHHYYIRRCSFSLPPGFSVKPRESVPVYPPTSLISLTPCQWWETSIGIVNRIARSTSSLLYCAPTTMLTMPRRTPVSCRNSSGMQWTTYRTKDSGKWYAVVYDRGRTWKINSSRDKTRHWRSPSNCAGLMISNPTRVINE